MTHTFALVSKCVANCGQSTFDRRGYGANWPERCDSPPLGSENDGGHGVECVLRRSEAGNNEIRSRARKASIVRREKISSAGEGLVQGTIAVITQCGADQPERDRPPLSVPGLQDSASRVRIRNRSFSAPPETTSPIVPVDHRDMDAAQSLVLPEKTRLTPPSFLVGG